MKSDVIKRRLYQKAIVLFPFWLLSVVFWFTASSPYNINVCELYNKTNTCTPYSISKFSEFKENSQLQEFNSEFLLYQIIPINILCILPLLGYMYVLSAVLKADIVKKGFILFGFMILTTIPLFLIVSISIFPFNLKTAICYDLENKFIENSITNFNNLTICKNGEEFNYFKGSLNYDNTTIEWGIGYQWYFIICSIIFSGMLVIAAAILLIKDTNFTSIGSNKDYSLFHEQDNDENYDDDDPNDVIETGLELWGRNIWYKYTKPTLNLKLLSLIQLIYISTYFSLYYFGFKYNLIPFFINLAILFTSYYFLIFNGMRDNYLIKRMYRENINSDINQFIQKIRKTKPKIAITKTPNKEELDIGIETILEPKTLKSWADNSEEQPLFEIIDGGSSCYCFSNNNNKPIIELTILEEFKTNTKLPNNASSILFVKTDLPNYYILRNKKSNLKINRGIHSFFVIIGFSCLFKLIYLNRLIYRKTIIIKTSFEYST